MKISFTMVLRHDPRFLQKEIWDFSSIRLSSTAELDLKVFSLRCENTWWLMENKSAILILD